MSLNIVLIGSACLFVGFLLGWVVGRPRRWGAFAADQTPVPGPGDDPYIQTPDL